MPEVVRKPIVGVTGQVTFNGEFVIIDRRKRRAKRTIGKGEKRIAISSITAVAWKPATHLSPGSIQFTLPGAREKRARLDENSVVFTRKQMPDFEHLRKIIERAIAGRSHSAPTPASQPRPAAASDEIAKLAKLHADGVLTDQEFSAAKARVLGL